MGASPDPTRFSHKAVKLLQRHGYEVIPVGRRNGSIAGISIRHFDEQISEPVHTLSLYLSPKIQKKFYDYMVNLQPQRIIFNPGTENAELEEIMRRKGVEIVKNCNLIMLHQGIF